MAEIPQQSPVKVEGEPGLAAFSSARFPQSEFQHTFATVPLLPQARGSAYVASAEARLAQTIASRIQSFFAAAWRFCGPDPSFGTAVIFQVMFLGPY